jgi:hypothetical protein
MHHRQGVGGGQAIAKAGNANHSRGLGSADRLHLVASGQQGADKMPVLAREILMDDQNLQWQT